MTLFPTKNVRVEGQGFGRTGRQGRNGTFHYILAESEIADFDYEDDVITIEGWQKVRDQQTREISLLRRKEKVIFHTEFVLQKLFFQATTKLKGRVSSMDWQAIQEMWAEYYSEIVDILREVRARQLFHQHHSATASCCEILTKFWNEARISLLLENEEMTPLHFAVMTNEVELAQILATHYSAWLESEDSKGKKPLYYYTSQGMKVALDGCIANAQNSSSLTSNISSVQ